MASKSQNVGKDQHIDGGRNYDGATHNHDGCAVNVHQLYQELHKSPDLTCLVFGSILSESFSYLEPQNISDKIGNGFQKKEKKRHVAEIEISQEDKKSDSHLDLRLSPPGGYATGKLLKGPKSPYPESEDSCVSAELDSDEIADNSIPVKRPSLILMGCTWCLLYVMVPDADPKCPQCNSYVLLDLFRDNQVTHAKRSRRN